MLCSLEAGADKKENIVYLRSVKGKSNIRQRRFNNCSCKEGAINVVDAERGSRLGIGIGKC